MKKTICILLTGIFLGASITLFGQTMNMKKTNAKMRDEFKSMMSTTYTEAYNTGFRDGIQKSVILEAEGKKIKEYFLKEYGDKK